MLKQVSTRDIVEVRLHMPGVLVILIYYICKLDGLIVFLNHNYLYHIILIYYYYYLFLQYLLMNNLN